MGGCGAGWRVVGAGAGIGKWTFDSAPSGPKSKKPENEVATRKSKRSKTELKKSQKAKVSRLPVFHWRLRFGPLGSRGREGLGCDFGLVW